MEADRKAERAAEVAGGGVDSLVVMPPSIELKSKWLVTTIAKAEYLPVMDINVVGGAGGGDFFFQVRYIYVYIYHICVQIYISYGGGVIRGQECGMV